MSKPGTMQRGFHCSDMATRSLLLSLLLLLTATITDAFVVVKSSPTTALTRSYYPPPLWAKRGFNMEELKQRIAESSLWFHAPPPDTVVPQHVYILMVALPGGTDDDPPEPGVHTIEENGGQNLVLAFADRDACQLFADKLRDEPHFVDPTPQVISMPSFDTFCRRLGVYGHFVPTGIELEPPRTNVAQLGQHNARARHQEQDLDSMMVDNSVNDDDDDDDDDEKDEWWLWKDEEGAFE